MKNLFCLIFIIVLATNTYAYLPARIVVAQDGSGNFKTVQQAIDAVADNSTKQTEIFVKKGTYKEGITVSSSKTNVTLIGEDVTTTILTFDNYASRPDTAGKPLGTSRTASFFVNASGFTAKNITFQNSAGPVGQAVAIRVDGDKAAFFNCRFLGFQDTMYTYGRNQREYYKDCYIEGTTDYIFGSSTVLFENCELFCKRGGGYVTAASTPDSVKYGYVLINCKITGDAPDNSYALGRPWRPYAKVVYIHCELGKMIKPQGWDIWKGNNNDKTAYYAEYKNSGEGFKPDQRVPWSHQLTNDEVKLYSPKLILNGWEPKMP